MARIKSNKLCECGCGQYTYLARHTDRNRDWIKGQPLRFLPYHAGAGKPITKFRRQIQVNHDTLCWEWRARIKGRPTLRVDGRNELAYRFSYIYFIGEIPDGLMVCHDCDNPICCNPFHLFLGTNADNMADAAIKGRMSSGPSHSWFQPRGEDVYCAKLTPDDVRWIRANYIPRHKNFGQRAMARKFGVDHATIGLARRGISWKTI